MPELGEYIRDSACVKTNTLMRFRYALNAENNQSIKNAMRHIEPIRTSTPRLWVFSHMALVIVPAEDRTSKAALVRSCQPVLPLFPMIAAPNTMAQANSKTQHPTRGALAAVRALALWFFTSPPLASFA